MSSALCMGPLLLFRGLDADALHLCALTVTDGAEPPGDLAPEGGRPVAPERLLGEAGRVLWRYEFSLPTGLPSARYRVAGGEYTVHLPPPEGPRLLFTACNGSEEPEELPEDPARNRTWRMIGEAHRRTPYHLLLQGGDQVYADQVWNCHPALVPLRTARQRALGVPFDAAMAQTVGDFYFDLYVETFGHPDIAPIVASVPSLMMWDDHDIFDGWGSWRPELQQSDVFRGLCAAARGAFAAFQLGVHVHRPLPRGFLDTAGGHFGWVQRLGRVALWAPDLRSERTQDRILGPGGWDGMEAALAQARGCEHLFVISSVPLLNTPMRGLERLHFAFPGHQYFQDDLRDQWQSYAHAAQWERFVDRLLRFQAETGARITVLSGEIHMGAYGLLEAADGRIRQLTSSGVVHPPLPRLVVKLMDWFSRKHRHIGRRAVFRMLPVPGFGKGRYLDERNWLALEPGAGGYVAQWCAEESGSGAVLRLD